MVCRGGGVGNGHLPDTLRNCGEPGPEGEGKGEADHQQYSRPEGPFLFIHGVKLLQPDTALNASGTTAGGAWEVNPSTNARVGPYAMISVMGWPWSISIRLRPGISSLWESRPIRFSTVAWISVT